MSLQVWLPLNGSLENNGLSNVTTSISSTEFLEGKIGKYSLNIKNSQFKININNNIITPSNGISISMWLKIKVTDNIIDSQEVWQNVLWMNYLNDSIEFL